MIRCDCGAWVLCAGVEGCTDLHSVVLRGNQLTTLDHISQCTLLVNLNAGDNHLEQFPAKLPCVLLTSLSLKGNRQGTSCSPKLYKPPLMPKVKPDIGSTVWNGKAA